MKKSQSSKLKNLILNHPVGTYYTITFLISWGGLVLMLGGPGRITAQPTDAPFLPLYFITVAGPCIAGIVLTGLCNGRKGYRDFFSRLFKWKTRIKWYAIALLIAPFTLFITGVILYLFSPVFLPGIFQSGENPVASMFGLPGNNKILLVLFVIIIGLFNGFVEEVGWTGFTTPALLSKHRFLATGFQLGIMWGLWHLFSNYIGSAKGAGTFPLPLYIIVILFSFLPPFRILMTWVYTHTQSLFIVILMHASLDVFWILSMPPVLTGQQRVTWYVLWAVVLWSLVVIVAQAKKKKEQTPKNKEL